MGKQQDLPFTQDSTVSSGEAESASQASTMRASVFRLLHEYGPHTDQEIQLALGMGGSTERPRRIELVEALLVRDSGQRRPTRSGRMAVVWEVRES
jgi:hypothetical protein